MKMPYRKKVRFQNPLIYEEQDHYRNGVRHHHQHVKETSPMKWSAHSCMSRPAFTVDVKSSCYSSKSSSLTTNGRALVLEETDEQRNHHYGMTPKQDGGEDLFSASSKRVCFPIPPPPPIRRLRLKRGSNAGSTTSKKQENTPPSITSTMIPNKKRLSPETNSKNPHKRYKMLNGEEVAMSRVTRMENKTETPCWNLQGIITRMVS